MDVHILECLIAYLFYYIVLNGVLLTIFGQL